MCMRQIPDFHEYVFSRDKRLLNKTGGYAVTLLLLPFIIAFIKDMLMGDGDSVAYMLVIMLFISICLYSLWGSKRYREILSLRYFLNGVIAKNQSDQKTHSVNVMNSIFISKLLLSLHMRGGHWLEQYYLVSNKPIQKVINHESGGLHIPKDLWDNGVVILPVNEQTNNWIKQAIGDSNVPQYPVVAYLSRHG